ncbi:MAG: hypothetical protein J6B23_04445 [Clostridia bacterium]|nr:hypothetical protein [Clostridia bacterium]
MYKISVPIMNNTIKRCGRELILKELKKLNAKRVFLALGTYEADVRKREDIMAELADNCRFFKENGFEVGSWIWTFWIKENKWYRNMRAISGTEITEFMCPTDESFVEFACGYIKDVAKCGVDVIMFDDDFRYGFLADSPACLCDGHIEIINSITGDPKTREELEEFITNGKPNKYRDAYIKANGDAFKNFATSVRNAVDEINPEIRIGACACLTSWDIDGVKADELSKILAGNTKPFVRLIGAPYWAVKKNWGNLLQDVVELERMESSWTKFDGLEIMAEGDSYPRPRSICPASYLEGFDTAIRASGCTDGILKYAIDYCSNSDYETGYTKAHERNRGLYKGIDEMFANKKHCGVRVYEYPEKLSAMTMPTKANDKIDIQNMFFSKAARTLAFNTIPSVYEGSGVCGIVFDENARHIPEEALKNGLIIDIAAAEILSERGIDTGIEKIENDENRKSESIFRATEHFIADNNHILTMGASFCNVSLKPGVEILSDIESETGTVPISFRYENANGNKFLILNINTRSDDDSLLKHYARSRQYAENVLWLSGEKLPAYVYGNPSLYMQCKQDDTSLFVGLWNFFADTAIEPVIELSKEYKEIKFLNCNGRLDGDRVYLNDIAPFGFAAVELK